MDYKIKMRNCLPGFSMKILFIFIVSCLFISNATGQNWNEWFRQRRTQIRYLQTQIVELQAQIMLLKKGYDVAKEGWEFIQDMTNGEFELHKDKVSRLDKVNRVIDEDPEKTKREIEALIQKSK